MWVPQLAQPVHFFPATEDQTTFGVEEGDSLPALIVAVPTSSTLNLIVRDTDDQPVTRDGVALVMGDAAPPGGGVAYATPWA